MWSDAHVLAMVLAVVGIVAVAATIWIYASPLPLTQPGPIRGDGLGYYAYLPAVFLDHDLSLRSTAHRSFGDNPTAIQGVRRVAEPGRNGKSTFLDQYGIGEAVLVAPFFALGYSIAAATNQARGGFSWPFQAAASAAGLVYMLLGLALVVSILARWLSRNTVVLTVLALTFGAAVFDYGTFETTMSHVYSFFAIALAVRLTFSVWDAPKRWNVIALGTVLGLVGLIRLTNLSVIVFCALVGVSQFGDLRRRIATLAHNYRFVAAGGAALLLTLLPQFAYWHHITGHWLTDPYRGKGEHLDLFHPHLVGVLFSVRKGLFFWTPLLGLACTGLILLRRTARPVFVSSIVYLPIAIWIVASWSIWWYGVSFGMRALIDEMPIFALGLAALIEATKSPVTRPLLLTAIGLSTLVAIHGMLGYWLNLINGDNTTFRIYLQSLHSW